MKKNNFESYNVTFSNQPETDDINWFMDDDKFDEVHKSAQDTFRRAEAIGADPFKLFEAERLEQESRQAAMAENYSPAYTSVEIQPVEAADFHDGGVTEKPAEEKREIVRAWGHLELPILVEDAKDESDGMYYHAQRTFDDKGSITIKVNAGPDEDGRMPKKDHGRPRKLVPVAGKNFFDSSALNERVLYHEKSNTYYIDQPASQRVMTEMLPEGGLKDDELIVVEITDFVQDSINEADRLSKERPPRVVNLEKAPASNFVKRSAWDKDTSPETAVYSDIAEAVEELERQEDEAKVWGDLSGDLGASWTQPATPPDATEVLQAISEPILVNGGRKASVIEDWTTEVPQIDATEESEPVPVSSPEQPEQQAAQEAEEPKGVAESRASEDFDSLMESKPKAKRVRQSKKVGNQATKQSAAESLKQMSRKTKVIAGAVTAAAVLVGGGLVVNRGMEAGAANETLATGIESLETSFGVQSAEGLLEMGIPTEGGRVESPTTDITAQVMYGYLENVDGLNPEPVTDGNYVQTWHEIMQMNETVDEDDHNNNKKMDVSVDTLAPGSVQATESSVVLTFDTSKGLVGGWGEQKTVDLSKLTVNVDTTINGKLRMMPLAVPVKSENYTEDEAAAYNERLESDKESINASAFDQTERSMSEALISEEAGQEKLTELVKAQIRQELGDDVKFKNQPVYELGDDDASATVEENDLVTGVRAISMATKFEVNDNTQADADTEGAN